MLFMVMVFTHAQEKANVLVEKFTAEGGYTDSDIRTLRENVIRALVKTMRVNVLDTKTVKPLTSSILYLKVIFKNQPYPAKLQKIKEKDLR